MPSTLVQPYFPLESHCWGELPEPPFAFTHPRDFPLRDPRKKLTVVLDLDETLLYVHAPVDIRGKDLKRLTVEEKKQFTLYIRPGAREFLAFLRSLDAEILVWTSGSTTHANRCCALLGGSEFIDAAVSRGHPKEWDIKDLSYLLKDKTRKQEEIVFVDDNIDHLRVNGEQGYCVVQMPPFKIKDSEADLNSDDALIVLQENFLSVAPPLFQEVARGKSLSQEIQVSSQAIPPVLIDKDADEELVSSESISFIQSRRSSLSEESVCDARSSNDYAGSEISLLSSQRMSTPLPRAEIQVLSQKVPPILRTQDAEVSLAHSALIQLTQSPRSSFSEEGGPGNSSAYTESELSLMMPQRMSAPPARSSSQSSYFFSKRRDSSAHNPRHETSADFYEKPISYDAQSSTCRCGGRTNPWPRNTVVHFPAQPSFPSIEQMLIDTFDSDVEQSDEQKSGIWLKELSENMKPK